MEANLKNKPNVANVESGQNCKAKTRLNWLRNKICDIFSRLAMILYSLHIFIRFVILQTCEQLCSKWETGIINTWFTVKKFVVFHFI